jgi:hypothetical protein
MEGLHRMDGTVSAIVSPKLHLAALAMGLALLAGCVTPPPPVVVAPPPPPPPPAQLVPPRPAPPGGAAAMALPAVGLDGNRLTINSGLTTAQTTWNLRSGLNVAALNCLEPEHAAILGNYTEFLTKFERPLKKTSGTILEEFRGRFGRSQGQNEFDGYMTQVYNYFALPPSLDQFCDAALLVSADSTLVAPTDLDSFAARALPRLEAVFQDFFRSYENYERSLASWTAAYGVNAVPGTPVQPWMRTGSLAPTAGEQVLYRETPSGEAYAPVIGTVEVLAMPAEALAVPAEMGTAPSAIRVPEQAVTSPLPQIDPGASEVAADPVFAAPSMELAPAPVPAPAAAGAIVFTSQPVVQPEPAQDE